MHYGNERLEPLDPGIRVPPRRDTLTHLSVLHGCHRVHGWVGAGADQGPREGDALFVTVLTTVEWTMMKSLDK